MNVIESYYSSSLASQAAYANIPLIVPEPGDPIDDEVVALALQSPDFGNFTEAQAAYFISQYKVWDQFTDPTSGFSGEKWEQTTFSESITWSVPIFSPFPCQ